MATGAAAQEPSTICIAAAHRIMPILIQEAQGTRHEAQIAGSIADRGGQDKAAADLAATLKEDACAMLVVAPDSTLRAFAISMLPERAGK